MSAPLLDVKDIHLHYGGIYALQGISLRVYKGEIVALIGANGAGKSSTLKAISALNKLTSGQILFDGHPIEQLKANKIVALGLSHCPEGRLVFPELSIKENLEMGAYLRSDDEKIEQDLDYTYQLFPKLKQRSSQLAGTLSGGEQQMLAIARAYMSAPKLLMLDEPSLGIAPLLVRDIFAAIKDLNQKGITILLVEQNANIALKLAHRGYVMASGEIVQSATGAELLANDDIKKAYLGQ